MRVRIDELEEEVARLREEYDGHLIELQELENDVEVWRHRCAEHAHVENSLRDEVARLEAEVASLSDEVQFLTYTRESPPGIGAVVAMVAAANVKTALYRQTLRCWNGPYDGGPHRCVWCDNDVD